MKEKLAHFFKTHKSATECFSTADEQLFFRENDARAHAASLADKKVIRQTPAAAKPGKEVSEPVKD